MTEQTPTRTGPIVSLAERFGINRARAGERFDRALGYGIAAIVGCIAGVVGAHL